MLFNSLTFVVFFCVVFLLYWRLAHRWQNWMLVAASMYFYGSWNASLLWLIVFSATLDYFAGRGIEAARTGSGRRGWLIASVVANLGVLSFFKYYGFFVENFAQLLTSIGLEASLPTLNLILPVGISFYTFQSMSYTVDVYRGKIGACRGYLDFLLYVSFFPQLVAGPIERGSHFLPQVLQPRNRLNLGHTLEALKLIVIGYVQKVAIADTLAPTVAAIFGNAGEMDSFTLLLGVYAFAGQIYCDFSGYSKIARGTARLLGFRLMKNFEEPYLTTDITSFWRSWHISLSTWLRDYLYIPLGGNRKGRLRTHVHLMTTMLLGGLWHGASWNYVLWGGLHGAYLSLHKVLGRGRRQLVRSPLRALLGGFLTFHAVCLAWIFFRAETLDSALTYLGGLGQLSGRFTIEAAEIAFYLAALLALDILLMRRRGRPLLHLVSRNWVVETVAVTLLLLVVLLVGENEVVPFVYFQF